MFFASMVVLVYSSSPYLCCVALVGGCVCVAVGTGYLGWAVVLVLRMRAVMFAGRLSNFVMREYSRWSWYCCISGGVLASIRSCP